MTNFAKALLDPVSVYELPMDVVADNTLTFEQKKQVLAQWEYDARELEIAEDENMPDEADRGTMMHRVLEAIHKLEEQNKS